MNGEKRMKKLLLLGGSKYLLPAIEAAHNIGMSSQRRISS